MNSLELIKILRKDLSQSKSQFISIKFFRRNLSSYWVWICILERFFNNNNNNNIENIIKEIPSEHASRPTLFKIIDDAVKKKYLVKEIDKNDKRKFNLFPTSQTINEFEEWAKIFKGF
jgi:DNA-binding MarR family transcriptional regulator